MTILIILAAVLIGFPLPCSDDAVKELRLAFRPAREPAAAQGRRTRALDGISGEDCDSPALAKALSDAALQLQKEIRPVEEERRSFLAGKRIDKKLKLRVDLDPLRSLQERVRSALLGLKDPSALAGAVERAFADKKMDLTLRIALAGKADALGAAACKKITPLLRGSGRPAGQLVALEAARALGENGSSLGSSVIACLGYREPAVREAAAAALAALCLPESIEPLVDRLAVEEGRTRDRIGNALQVLTRQGLGTSAAVWRRWLAAEGKPFLNGEVPLGGGVVSRGASAESKYHEIPIDGRSILYVFDCSLSMNQPMEGKNAAEKKPGNESGETRFDRAGSELLRALRTLPPYKRFNILAFEGRCRLFDAGMVRASPDRIEGACKWVDKLKLKFGTQLYDALDLSFATAGREIEDRFYDAAIDTIFVLTDGVPYVGNKPDPFGRIRDAVRRWNLNRRVVIHVIGLGNKLPAKKLRAFAEENGGRFVHERSR
jgi:hypothetical protein